MFATDRDLLTLEPNLFRDVGWVSQRLLKAIGEIEGSTVTISGYDADFEAADVGAGNVIVVDGAPYEVVERLSPTEALISRLRASPDDPPLPPSPTGPKPTIVPTMRPQIALVHAQVLRMVGIEPSDAPGDGPAEQDITNPGALTRLEALGALHLIYSAAAAPAGSAFEGSLWSRARMYRERFARERQRVAARIDLDGDGLPDAVRRFNMIQFIRD